LIKEDAVSTDNTQDDDADFVADDLIDLGDMPEIPDGDNSPGIPDAFSYDTAFKFSFVGVGQAGGRLAEEFYRLGYRSVCAVNTAVSDLASIKLPDANKLDLGGGGAGKDPSIAAAAAAGQDEPLYDLFKTCLGDDIDYAIICLGAGGGTGAGAWSKVHEVLQRYLDETKRPVRIGVIVALPKNGEGNKPAKNAFDTMKGLDQAKLSPTVIVDNERINQIFRKLPIAKFWPTCNAQICSLFHLFNRIAAQDSPHTSFDRQDLAKLLDSGTVTFGATPIKEYSTQADISRAVRQQLKANTLAAADLSTGKVAGCIFVCGKDAYENANSEILDHGFESLNRMLGEGSTVFRGVYPGNNEAIRAYVMVGGLDFPADRMRELAKIAGID
jgi:cell division GTPase FtsZ